MTGPAVVTTGVDQRSRSSGALGIDLEGPVVEQPSTEQSSEGQPSADQPSAGQPPSASRPGGVRPAHPARYDELPTDLPLTGWARVFLGRRGPQLLAVAAVAMAVRRLRLGRWRWADATVAATVVTLHPFAEWLVHVRVLHRRPRVVDGRRRESRSARMHRLHHEDPKDIDLVLLPLRSVVGLVIAVSLPAVVNRDRRRGATSAAVSLGSLLAYEWVHFLIHSPHRPKRSLYRARWRAHRLHHFRNERYWFGVVGTVADRVLGTAPDRRSVPLSPTARTLGVEPVDASRPS
jgi:hypothetical protein